MCYNRERSKLLTNDQRVIYMKRSSLIFISAAALILSVIFICSINAAPEYYIKVNRTTNCVTVYDSTDTAVKSMICSVGNSAKGNSTPTGTFNTSEKYRWRDLFSNEYGQYATRITGHILFHSVPYYSEDPSDLNTANYNSLGTQDSLGCVRLTVGDAKWIYDNCPIGTTVTIFDGTEADDPLGRPAAIKLGSAAPYPTWDPTDPDENNPWKDKGVNITVGKYVRSIYQNSYQTADELKKYLRTGVKAYDTAGNEMDFTLETNIDPNVCGVYHVTYSATDILGRTGSKNTIFIVLPAKLVSDAPLK